MADEEAKLDIEEEVPAIEDEVKKPEKDEGKVDAAEREWNYQREPDAQDLKAPDIFATYRKETLPIFNMKDVSIDTSFGTASQDEKQRKKPTKPKMTKPRPTATGSLNTGKRPQYGTFEAHLVKNPDTTRYNFMRSMLEFHDKIVGDVQSEEEPIGAQPTGTGRRVTGAPFKMGKGKKTGQLTSMLGSKKLPFGAKGKKGTKGRGAKRRQSGTTATTSGGMTGAMGKLNATYEPKLNPKGHQILSPQGGKVGQKKRRDSGVKVSQTRSGAQQQAINQPSNAGTSGQITPPKEEKRKIPRPKKLNRKGEKKEAKRLLTAERGKKTGTYKLTGEAYRKQQAAEAAAKRKKIRQQSSGSGAPKELIRAMIKAWYGEIYGI
jgi:hypothetical protein